MRAPFRATRTRKQSWIMSAFLGLMAAGEWVLVLASGIGWLAVIAALCMLLAIVYLVSAVRWRGGASHDDDEASPAS